MRPEIEMRISAVIVFRLDLTFDLWPLNLN